MHVGLCLRVRMCMCVCVCVCVSYRNLSSTKYSQVAESVCLPLTSGGHMMSNFPTVVQRTKFAVADNSFEIYFIRKYFY